MSKSHDVKMYPIEPCRDGSALIEYDVLNNGLGDFEMANFTPDGTSKSRIASHIGIAATFKERDERTIG